LLICLWGLVLQLLDSHGVPLGDQSDGPTSFRFRQFIPVTDPRNGLAKNQGKKERGGGGGSTFSSFAITDNMRVLVRNSVTVDHHRA
jgi:hypothetical protein